MRLPRRILTKILLKKLKSVLGHLFHTGKTSIQKSSYGKFHMVLVSLSSLLHLLLPTTTTAIGKNAFRLSFLETSITDLGGKYVFCSLEICTSDVCYAICCKLRAHRHSLMQQTKNHTKGTYSHQFFFPVYQILRPTLQMSIFVNQYEGRRIFQGADSVISLNLFPGSQMQEIRLSVDFLN